MHVHTFLASLCSVAALANAAFGPSRKNSIALRSYEPPSKETIEAANSDVTCKELSAKYPTLLYYPYSSNYTFETTRYWDEAAVLNPYCVFTPQKTSHVAGAMALISKNKSKFAVRSGGHMPVVGAASTSNGVLIGMTAFTNLKVISTPNRFNTTYASFGPGLTWGQIYDKLAPYGLTVSAGRVYSVGTSLALGGGLSYFSGSRGWAANGIVNLEVVLANGTTVQANKYENPSLYWALKGGSSNFGIVTRYQFEAFGVGKIFGGAAAWGPEQYPEFLAAQSAFISPGGGSEDPKAAIMTNWQLSLVTGNISSGTVNVYSANDPNPVALRNFTNIPVVSGGFEVQEFNAVTAATQIYATRDFRWAFYDICIKFDPKTMYLINDTLVTLAYQQLRGLNVSIGAAIQPVTKSHLESARRAGGDAIDLDPANGSFVICLVYATWDDPNLDDEVARFEKSAVKELSRRAKKEGLLYPFVFLNDAGPGQDPFRYYGGGKSLPKMRAVSRKYDPEQVFQRQTGGFRLI